MQSIYEKRTKINQHHRVLSIVCPECSNTVGKAEQSGNQTHAAKVICSGCDRHIKWLSKRDAAKLLGDGGTD